MSATILLVEDEALLARNIGRFLERSGHEVEIAGRVDEGLAKHAAGQPDIILVDHNLPDGSGIDLIKAIRRSDRAAKIVMITAHGSVQLAVEAMKAGADDYLVKPVALEEVGLLVERLRSQSQAEGSLAYYRRKDESRSGLDQIIGTSPAVQEMKARIAQIVAMQARQLQGTPPPVLITGETGTGKELVARALHFDGPRRNAPFVELNCAALPAHLIESELFGHEKGAFTDAKERRVGLIQSADRGTLFLDEIGELPLAAQAKLLKVLEDSRVRPLGATRERQVDIRIIAATNAAIEDRTASGAFRADLYYRLRGVAIETPPLRSRGGDVVLLAEHFLTEHRRRYGRAELSLSEAAAATLTRHRWPGNVRELRNAMEQAALLTVGERIEPGDLSLREPPPLGSAPDGGIRLQSAELELIGQALTKASGNVTVAAEALGISRDTLRYRMERHNLRRAQFV
ncbi:MAG: sigma-54 dependent transcriptional regulator [Alphaproteobacteria bacterium]|nr:sigma-54 dependent transcriptional regulator [Alphaproteobacteria bacterium]